ncbi:MAG: hypothetical protein HN793_11120, partial [Rhodospirillaceae bacterium]|nr:hypothetical protein [Rhodospirillaceae bacterium]
MAEQAVEQQSESEAPDKQADGTPAPVSTEEPAAQGATAPDPIPAPVGAFITVRDRYSIFYDRPVPSLDMPNALAFEVEDRKQPGRALYALISKPEMLARISVMRILKGNEVSNTLQMVDWGAADWPPADRKCIIIIYFRPLGGRVMDSLSAIREKIPEHQFPKLIIKPIADALIELGQKGITHRAIRPDNLYYMDEGRQKIVLGDCCTSVAASDQPVVLESIESGMSGVYGRGSGMYADDMYSFGVTL